MVSDSNGDLILLDSARDLYALICSNKEKCMAGVAIPLSIVEWPPKSSAVTTRNGAASKQIGCCRECGNGITDFMFQCIECDDCDLCGSCITSGKHPQHIIICSIDSKVSIFLFSSIDLNFKLFLLSRLTKKQWLRNWRRP